MTKIKDSISYHQIFVHEHKISISLDLTSLDCWVFVFKLVFVLLTHFLGKRLFKEFWPGI